MPNGFSTFGTEDTTHHKGVSGITSPASQKATHLLNEIPEKDKPIIHKKKV